MLYSSDRPQQRPDLRIKVAEELKQFSLNTYRSIFIVHWVGYGLLLFWLVDTCFLLFPFRVADSSWIFTVLQGLVGSTPVLLVGFVLTFFGERKPRLDWEFLALKILSWWTGCLCILFVLLIPFTILIGLQVAQNNQTLLGQTVQVQISQIQTFKNSVESSQSPSDLEATSRLLGLNVKDPNVENSKSEFPKTKESILRRLNIQEKQLKNKTESQIEGRNLSTLKQSIKICLGALMASILLFLFWNSTLWARQFNP